MSHAQNDIYLENLIQRYREISSILHSEEAPWMYTESDLEDIAAELLDLGVNVEDID